MTTLAQNQYAIYANTLDQRRYYGRQLPAGTLSDNITQLEEDGFDTVSGAVNMLVYALKQHHVADEALTARLVKAVIRDGLVGKSMAPSKVERAGLLLDAMMTSRVTTSAELNPLFLHWLDGLFQVQPGKKKLADLMVRYEDDIWVRKADDVRFQAMVAGVGLHGSVPLMGTVWRFLTERLPTLSFSAMNSNIVAGGRAPLPVFARCSPNGIGRNAVKIDTDMFARKWDQIADRFWHQVEEEMPDLADLPQKMLLEVLITQPIPEEWFVDVAPVGDVTWLAPGVETVSMHPPANDGGV